MRALKAPLLISLAMAVLFLAALYLNDEFIGTRLVWWIVPLVKVQSIGMNLSSSLFPCRREGFDTGCEWFKVIPIVILSNAAVYSVILVPLRFLLTAAKKKQSSRSN
jgi:multisubunit Na+/H+ antiporter MnhB subunit